MIFIGVCPTLCHRLPRRQRLGEYTGIEDACPQESAAPTGLRSSVAAGHQAEVTTCTRLLCSKAKDSVSSLDQTPWTTAVRALKALQRRQHDGSRDLEDRARAIEARVASVVIESAWYRF